MWIEAEEETPPVRPRIALPPRTRDGIPAIAPELACLTVVFARDADRLDRAPDADAATPLEWLRHYRDLFWTVQGAFDAADRADEGPCRLLERGYYRIQVVATAPRTSPLAARRAERVAGALEALLLLEGEERPDVITSVERNVDGIDAAPLRRIEVRLVHALVE